ncbi:5749_t:CDS:2, partial [Gigaspora margarita]
LLATLIGYIPIKRVCPLQVSESGAHFLSMPRRCLGTPPHLANNAAAATTTDVNQAVMMMGLFCQVTCNSDRHVLIKRVCPLQVSESATYELWNNATAAATSIVNQE